MKEGIKKVLKEGKTLQTYGVTKEGTLLRISYLEESEKILEVNLSSTINSLLTFEEGKISNFDNEEKDHIYKYDLELTENLKELKSNIDKLKISNPEPDRKIELKKIKYFIFKFGTAKDNLFLIRYNFPINYIKKDKLFFYSKEVLEPLNEDLIRMDGKLDFIFIKETLYIKNISILEQQFGFELIIKNKANEIIDKVNTLDIIHNIQTIKDENDNLMFSKKIAKIKKESKIFTLKSDEIISFVDQKKSLKDKFSFINGKFNLDTKAHKNDFIKLMNNNFLYSELTKEDFETDGKKKKL